ncbi:MAG: zf-HC2 domain-containing protein [Oscillospiraceae bacterium]|nr:zf-HC2 domain-containing protein [Oscillospiraceae bacterium]
MTCDVIRDLLPQCADGIASEDSRAAVEAHIRTCGECRALYEEMCSPVEAQATEKELDYMAAVKRQKRQNRRFLLRIYGVTLAVILLLVLVWPGRLLFRDQVWMLESVPVNRETVEREMLQALLTRKEKELAKVLFSLPEVQEAFLAETEDPYSNLPDELYRDLLTRIGIDPDSPTGGYAAILGQSVILDYHDSEYRVILEFIDADQSGHADILRKTTSRVPEDFGTAATTPPEVGDFFSAEINAALIGTADSGDAEKNELSEDLHTTYEKHFEKRQWLYFLRQLFEKDT